MNTFLLIWLAVIFAVLAFVYHFFTNPFFLARVLRFFLRMRYKLVMDGFDEVMRAERLLIMPNHPAYIDPILLFEEIYARGRKVSPMTDEQFFANPVFRQVLGMSDAVMVPDLMKHRSEAAVRQAASLVQISVNALEEGRSLVFYPSGHVTLDGRETLGARRLAYETVCAINNSPENSPLRKMTVISNPLGEENSVMRTTMIGSMLETLARNYNLRNESAKLFEIGKTYIPTEEDKLPDEHLKITLGIYGDNADFFVLKGVVEELSEAMCVRGIEYMADKENPTFHPGRCAKVLIGGENVGIMGEIHPLVAKKYGFEEKVYVAEIEFEAFAGAVDTTKKFKALPKFPAVTRDLAVIIDNDVPVSEIEKVINESCGKILEKLQLFDVYKGKQIPEDKKSVAYALTMRSSEGTLADEEITNAMNKIIKNIETKLGGKLR